MKKLIKIFAVSFFISILSVFSAFANHWKYEQDGTWRLYDDTYGILVANTWCDNRYATYGGILLTDAITPDGYYVGPDGVWDGNAQVSPGTPVPTSSIVRLAPIEIAGIHFHKDSVGGVSPIIEYVNSSGKVIKYLTFTVTPYNAVNDKVISDIWGYSTTTFTVTGPINPSDTLGKWFFKSADNYFSTVYDDGNGAYVKRWCYDNNVNEPTDLIKYLSEEEIYHTFSETASVDCLWYNYSIDHITVDSVKVTYMDGTTQTASAAQIYR